MPRAPGADPLRGPSFHASITWPSPSSPAHPPSFSRALLPATALLTVWSWLPWLHVGYFSGRKDPLFAPSLLWRNRHPTSLCRHVLAYWRQFSSSALLFVPYGARSFELLRWVSFASAYSSLAEHPYFFFVGVQFPLPFSSFNQFSWMLSLLLIWANRFYWWATSNLPQHAFLQFWLQLAFDVEFHHHLLHKVWDPFLDNLLHYWLLLHLQLNFHLATLLILYYRQTLVFDFIII